MGNLRIQNVQVLDSTSIDITFTEQLVPELVTGNVSILADSQNVPDAEVLGVKVTDNTLSVTCQPLSPLASYFLQFQSTTLHPFTSIHGDFILPEDGVTNRFLITGPLSADNPVKNYLTSFLQDNIYNLNDDTTVISKYIQSLSVTLSRALYDIRQVKNENYLSFTVSDERKVRGAGAFDRLDEEGAYQIIRVGRGPSASNATTTYSLEEFPSFPITLQRQSVSENLIPSSLDKAGEFNINTLTLNLSSYPVTKAVTISFLFESANPIYNYDVETLGYQITDSRYDKDFASSYALLENNQIRINEAVLKDPVFTLDNLIRVEVAYESKNLGIVVNSDTVEVTTVLDATREVLPPIINVFNLAHAPIVDSNGDVPTLAGITFTDPNNIAPGAQHPAFTSEIPFRLNALPARIGQYSIDYSTGTVYVYGDDLNNNGTGAYPPLATYKYLLTYKSDQDYTYDSDLLDLVALPLGNLVDNSGTIEFSFEEVLVPGVDYNCALHQENLTERVENRLVALNALKVKSSPITNVFRIFNETSGEIYTLNRWNDDKIYFRYNTPPRVLPQVGERVSFKTIFNELLSTNTSFTNTNLLRVFKILLNSNLIVSSTEDGIASSINTSLVFSNGNIFINEIWYNAINDSEYNSNRLSEVGQYTADYVNGIVYVAVSNTQDFNLGTVSYKNDNIVPQFPHLISVEDIYYLISPLDPKNKSFSYVSFDDGVIVPEDLDVSDEGFLNESTEAPYQVLGGAVGIFFESGFVPGVTNQVKVVRSLYEYDDLLNNTHPLNFATSTTSSGFNINVAPITKQVFDSVQFDGYDYYVTLSENIPYLSPYISYNFSVVRISDGASLWDTTGTIVTGDPLKLILPGINSPMSGDLVNITYTFTILDISRVIVDYNKGDLFADYTYVADEIIVSYEYGDNVIDYRTSKALAANSEYFVSYKAGALRDALLKNFGTLVNIPELSNFDVDFNRERYRDALMAALSSFIQGPTVTAIKNIGKTISHIEPEIIESIFQGWSLGNSSLYAQEIETNGSFDLLPAKYANGVLINSDNQTITLPVNSNLRLEEGTFETWIAPQWNGLDNDAELTFTITRDGYVIDPTNVFIGSSEYHPEISDGKFSLNKLSSVSGLPNFNKDGLFIYYADDSAGDFQRWYLRIIDGYVTSGSSSYKVKIDSSGNFYDNKSLSLPKPSNMTIFSGVSNVNLSITGSINPIDEGITFISDLEHYLLDFGKEKNRSRLSIFKDVSGYFNFRVYDKDHTSFSVSTDVSGWKSGDLHHVAASWKLNTQDDRDEMHLFIDGLEVPNIIKYGQKLRPYLHEKFRTVDPEEVVGLPSSDIVGSVDLHTTVGNTLVSSSLNFSSFNIFPGDTIYIDEIGFSDIGYTIVTVSGQNLVLSSAMPATLTDGRFSINRTAYVITSDIDTAPNIAVSTIHVFVDGYDLTGTAASDLVSSAIDFEAAGVLPGFYIRIDDPDLPTVVSILQVSGTNLIIEEPLPNNLTGNDFWIYSQDENEIPGVRALRPAYSISKDSNFDNILTISNDVFANDLVLIRTLGINHRGIKRQYYVWSDNQESVLMTKMPPPISLDEAKITKIILPPTAIGPDNSVVTSVFTSNNFPTSQPSNSQNGRTISVVLAGTNVDFSTPAQVTISGIDNSMTPVIETISFTDYGSLDFANSYISINYVNIVVMPINPAKSAITMELREKYPITHSEFSGLAPVIRFSYHIGGGYNLYSDTLYTVRDEGNTFSHESIGNILLIHSPYTVAGFYRITGVSEDRKSLEIESTVAGFPLPLTPFTGGIYQILNVTEYRSGLQSGYFTLEEDKIFGQGYLLSSGFYELNYDTYDRIKFDPVNDPFYLGTNFEGHRSLNGIMDQVKIYSVMLTDTRIGESIPSNQRSVTKDFNSLKALKSDPNTLALINFDTFPFTNSASEYIDSTITKDHFHSNVVVNENFGNSLVIKDKPLVIPNDGILDTRKEGSIEFWVNPGYDTGNDPRDRFYFDAFGAVVEEVTSINNVSLKLSGPASQILSVTLTAGDPRIDYFVGGKIEIDTQNATQEDGVSIGTNIVQTSKFILQVISVKIAGDYTGADYFADGSIGPDKKTIYLGRTLPQSNLPLVITYQAIENNNDKINTQIIRLNKRLPYENSKVTVNYIPKGLQGDRIAIYKDNFGYINFAITASGTDYVVRAPTRWVKDTWHRVKASYKINGGSNTDELRLFLDGYEYTDVLFGTGLVFGKYPMVMGSSMSGDGYHINTNIKFRDPINDLFIGSEYTKQKPIFSLIDNFRISNISRPIYAPYGEPIDVNYTSNLDMAFPVTPDLYTTYLLDFGPTIIKNADFTLLKNRETGLFNFLVEIFDSFDIVKDSAKVQEVLEKLIKVLKPANSKVFIEYIG